MIDEHHNLARHQTVSELVRVYQEQVTRIKAAMAELADAEARIQEAFCAENAGPIYVKDRFGRTLDFRGESSQESVIERLRCDVWERLIRRLDVRRTLSVARAKELDKMVEQGELPEITVELVAAFARGFQDALPDMLLEAVEEVFEFLRPHGDRYKTNSQLEIGRRVVLESAVERHSIAGWRVCHWTEPRLTAMENVFSSLDGKGQVHKNYRSPLGDAIRAAGPDGRGDTTYFMFRCFKNGNLHIDFRRRDLLARFNALAGGKRLRPGKTE